MLRQIFKTESILQTFTGVGPLRITNGSSTNWCKNFLGLVFRKAEENENRATTNHYTSLLFGSASKYIRSMVFVVKTRILRHSEQEDLQRQKE